MKKYFLLPVFIVLGVCTAAFSGSEPQRDTRLVLNRGGGSVRDMAVSHNGRFLVTGGSDNVAAVWDVELGRIIRASSVHSGGVNKVAISPDDTMYATAGGDYIVHIWDFATGKLLRSFNRGKKAEDLCFSPDSKLLAMAGYPNIQVIRAADGAKAAELSSAMSSVAFSPDGSSLYAGAERYNTANWKRIRDYHYEYVIDFAVLSPDGKKLFTVDRQRDAQMIETETGNVLWKKSGLGYRQYIMGRPAVFYPDSSKISLVFQDEKGAVDCDAAAGKVLETVLKKEPVELMAIAADGTRVFSGYGLKVMGPGDQTTRQFNPARFHPASRVHFVDNGSGLFIGGYGGLRSVDMNSGEKKDVSKIMVTDSTFFSPDGRIRADGDNKNAIHVRNAKDDSELYTLKSMFSGHSKLLTCITISPDGKYLVSSGQDRKTLLWDTQKKEILRVLDEPTFSTKGYQFRQMAFSPDGSRIAGANDFGTVTVWSIPEGKAAYSTGIDLRDANVIAWTPDGKQIVVGGNFSGSMRILDSKNLAILQKMDSWKGKVRTFQFSPDGKTMVSGGEDNSITVWNTATWKQTMTLEGHIGPVTSLTFRPDGAYLVSGSEDDTVRVWHMPDGTFAGMFMDSTDGSLTIAPDGRYEASGKAAGGIHWVSGTEVIPLDGFGPEFRVSGLLPLLMKGSSRTAPAPKAPDKADVNVERQLIGKVFAVSGGEVIVAATFSGRLKVRDRLFVLIDGKKVQLEAVMPMHTSVKCRLAGEGKLKKGMPVFK